eukprot:g2072.t1
MKLCYLLNLLTFHALIGNAISTCNPGYFYSANGVCTQCPKGKYQGETGYTGLSCKTCEIGFYCPRFLPASCKEIIDLAGHTPVSGSYTLFSKNKEPYSTYCDMESDFGMGGYGGWQLVASVASQSDFWNVNTYSDLTGFGPTARTIGKPQLDENYVLHLAKWFELLNVGNNNSLRITIRQMEEDGGITRALGRFDGIKMRSNKLTFHGSSPHDHFLAYKLWKRRKHLDEDVVIARYGFLYEPYRKDAYLWDAWEMARKLFLTGIILLIYPGTTFQIVLVVTCNIFFFSFIAVEKPHVPGVGRTLATIASFAVTITMFTGLILSVVDETQHYTIFFSILLIGINGMVVVFAIYLIAVDVCSNKFKKMFGKYFGNQTKPDSRLDHKDNNKLTVEDKLKHYFTEKKIDLHKDICAYLKMPGKSRQEFKNRNNQNVAIAEFSEAIEAAMSTLENEKLKYMQQTRMLRLMSRDVRGDEDEQKKSKALTKVVPASQNGSVPSTSKQKAKHFWKEQ